jgi:hypothetical protein
MNYSYSIQSVDAVQKTMVVAYMSPGLEYVQLNVGIPVAGTNIDTYIQKFAPIQKWLASSATLADVAVGFSGLATYAAPVPPAPVAPASVNAMQEEYIRALIFQVLEEIKAAQV